MKRKRGQRGERKRYRAEELEAANDIYGCRRCTQPLLAVEEIEAIKKANRCVQRQNFETPKSYVIGTCIVEEPDGRFPPSFFW